MKKKSNLKFVLIIVLAAFAIVPAVILGTIGTFSIINYAGSVKQGELSGVSLSKSGAVTTVFNDYISDAEAFSKLDVIVSAAQGNADKAKEILTVYADANPDVIDAVVLNDKGSIVASAKGNEGSTFEHYSDSGLAGTSELLTWEKAQTSGFYVSREIYADPDNKTGGKLGYVCVEVSLAPESRIATALQGTYLDDKAHLMIVDTNGNTVNFDGQGTVMKKEQIDGELANKVSDIFSNTGSVTGDNDVKSTYTGTAGKNTFVAGIIKNNTAWRWVGIVDSSAFKGFAFSTNITGWIVIVVACVICIVVAVLVISKFMGKMHNMLNTMNNIVNNEENLMDVRFTVKNDKTELGSIQTSFNEFLDEVNMNSDRYRTISGLSDNMLFEWDFHKERMYVSDNFLQKFTINTEGATLNNGRFLDSLMTPEDADKYKRDISTLLKTKKLLETEYQLKNKDGKMVWVSFKANCLTDRLGDPLRVIGVMTDIDNEKKMELQLSERASYDFLSQLYNRSTFIRMLTTEVERRGLNKIGIMFIDVDDFKFINDRYGHTVGDEVIRYVADTIRTKVDDRGGFAGRFGGDEFVLCYTNQEDIENAEQIAMDIIDELYVGYTTTDGTLINVRASIGISYCPEHTEDVNDLLSFSDTAMYFVKKNGKTNYHVYVPEDSATDEYIDPEGF